MKKIVIFGITSILVLSGILVGAGNVVTPETNHSIHKNLNHFGCWGPSLLYKILVRTGIINNNITGLFIGGGTIGMMRTPRVTHGFILHPSENQLPNNLEVNWGGNHFHLDVLINVSCHDDPSIDPRPPVALFDTIHGMGEGRLNGDSGYRVEFIFTDAGEPGNVDWAWIKITRSGGNTTMEVSGFLKSGNQQALP